MKIISCPECGGKHTVDDSVKVDSCSTCKGDQDHVKKRKQQLDADPNNPIKKWRYRSAQRQAQRA